MLIIVVSVAFATFYRAQAYPLTLEDKENLLATHMNCRQKSGIEEAIVTKFSMGEQVDDPKLKEYLLCVSKDMGFQNENGKLQTDIIKDKLQKCRKNSTEVDVLMEKCAVEKESELETAFNIFSCYHENVADFDGILYVVSITPVKKRKLIKYHKQCLEETKVEEELVKKAHEGEFSDDSTFKQYLLCVSKKVGFQNVEGKLQKDVITQKLNGVLTNPRKVELLMKACVSEKEIPEDTAHSMIKCFCEKSYVTILPPIALPQEKLERLFTFYRECKKQTSVDKNLVIAASVGDFTEDPALKEYFLCMSKKVGFQNEEGALQKDVLQQKFEEAFNNSEASEKLLEKCAIQEESAVNTAYNTVKCYYVNTPNHTNIFQETTNNLSTEKKEELSNYNTECVTESEVDPEIIKQVKNGTFPDDEKLKNYLFCFFKKIGLQNESGEIKTKPLCHKIGKFLGDPALSEKLAQKCAIQMDTPGNTAFKALTCYYENTPSHFNILTIF